MAIPTRDTSLDGVKSNFARYGLLDDQVVFVKGYFPRRCRTSTPDASPYPAGGDIHEKHDGGAEWLYPKLSHGGFCIIDISLHLPTAEKQWKAIVSSMG